MDLDQEFATLEEAEQAYDLAVLTLFVEIQEAEAATAASQEETK